MKTRIMFVCHGNICRSPMAEFIMKELAAGRGMADGLTISSSATSTEEIWNGKGNPVYPPARGELALHGIECKGKHAVQLTADDYDGYDMIIAMDSFNIRNIKNIIPSDPKQKIWKLLDFASCKESKKESATPQRLSGCDISDPWYTGDFRSTYNDIAEGCEGVLNYLSLQNTK